MWVEVACVVFFQAEDGIRDLVRSRGLGDVYKRQLLWVAAAAVAGMSVAFPIAVGLALVIGVIYNYISESTGDPVLLFAGVGLVVVAIVVNAIAYQTIPSKVKGDTRKGVILSVLAGIIMGFFYGFVADSISLNFSNPEAGKLTPYSAVLVFSIGCYLSGFIWNTYFMYRPVEGRLSLIHISEPTRPY